jgi:hypothetical protein
MYLKLQGEAAFIARLSGIIAYPFKIVVALTTILRALSGKQDIYKET